MRIGEHPMADIDSYARIPISFEVTSTLDVSPCRGGLGGLEFRERRLERPIVKDDDAIPKNRPIDWLRLFDVSNWGLLTATDSDRLVGGVTIAFKTPGVIMLEQRSDLAVLWDIRVSPDARRRGIGAALFAAAVCWATDRGCQLLKIETQNTNVPACKFYARQGCTLGAIHRFAYPELPDEIQPLWYKHLSKTAA